MTASAAKSVSDDKNEVDEINPNKNKINK